MQLLDNTYELSVWEDIVQAETSEHPRHFDEQKIATISAADLTSPTRAYNVNLKTSISGEKTLTFQLLRQYQKDGELAFNPFLDMLINERKLKLRLGPEYEWEDPEELEEEDTDERWISFVIKNVEEDKNSFVNTYTAKESYVNELGKNGWAVLLDTDLENNYGTLNELGEKVLEGSDWKIGSDYEPVEALIEPLLSGIVSQTFVGYSVLAGTGQTITAGQVIYFGYSHVEPDTSQGWKLKSGIKQFLWKSGGFQQDDLDDNYLIIDENLSYNYEANNISITGLQLTGMNIGEAPLQGRIIQKVIDTHFDSKMSRYVNKYKVNNTGQGPLGLPVGSVVYNYNETEYLVSGIVSNYLTNTTNSIDSIGWLHKYSVGTQVLPQDEPTPPGGWGDDGPTNYLTIPLGKAGETSYYNEGPRNVGLSIVQEDIFLVRMKARIIKKDVKNYGPGGSNIIVSSPPNYSIVADIVEFDNVSQHPSGEARTTAGSLYAGFQYLDQTSNIATRGYLNPIYGNKEPYNPTVGIYPALIDEEGYAYTYLKATSTTTKKEKLMFRLRVTGGDASTELHVQDIQLVDYVVDTNGNPIFLNDIPEATIRTKPRYYHYIQNEPIYLATNSSYYNPVYRENYIAVRHINVKESNYFNNITSLAELFEVWVRFRIKHQKNGKIWLDDDKKPLKEILFSNYTPYGTEPNQAGFKYGINLKNIKRRIASDTIASKVIVKNNSQKYAKDGTASISRVDNNPSGENVIFNFDYYINQGLLDQTQVLRDLYGLTLNDLSYLPSLKALNIEYNEIAELLQSYAREIVEAEKYIELYEEGIAAAKESYEDENYIYKNTSPADTKIRDRAKLVMGQVHAQANAFRASREEALTRKAAYEQKLAQGQIVVNDLLEQKAVLHDKFYEKYSRYIQEGTWTDTKYIDDDLYYLDALKISATNAFPKVSYDIDVADIHVIPGYENYQFKVGQRTYIEDTEFFGWTIKSHDGLSKIKTPYKMEVVISEYTHNLDNPDKSTITIQNYKNQYEDLFQKIVATTNQLQYQSGQLASVVDQFDNGVLKKGTLEAAFSQNAFILASASNQNITWDARRGIEITDLLNTNLMLRIVSRGLFLTSDGGNTWDAAITGRGINTRYLRAGEIDADRINIITKGLPIFRWDGDGISAFVEDDLESYDADRFVRFNQFGIYGTTNGTALVDALDQETTFTGKQNTIRDYSNFSLTWDGLFFQSGAGDISLGRYKASGSESYDYGIRLRNNLGEDTLVTDQDGNLRIRGTLSSMNYISDLAGWQITQNGTAEFENAVIRGMLKSTVFVYDEINAQGGSLIIARSNVLGEDLILPAKPSGGQSYGTIDFKTKDFKPGIFQIDDTVKILTHLTPENKVITWLKIIAINNEIYTARILSKTPDESVVINAGVPVINYGVKDTGYLLLRADDLLLDGSSHYGPYMDIIINTSDDVHVDANQELKVRLGDLEGINDNTFNYTPIEGYGLYASNAYLKGSLILPNAGMTDFTDSSIDNNVRIWAGGSYVDAKETSSTVPFRVYHDGTMIASKGEIGRWLIDTNKIYSMTAPGGSFTLSSASDSTNDYWITAKNNQEEITFSVSKNGQLSATGAYISGTVIVGDNLILDDVLADLQDQLDDNEGVTILGEGFASFVQRVTGSSPPADGDYSTTTIIGGIIKTGTITASELAANAVTANKIKAGAVNADKIVSGAIEADKIATGAVQADKIATGAIEAKHIKTNELTADKFASIAGFTFSNSTMRATNDGNYVRISGAPGLNPILVGPSNSDLRFVVKTDGSMTATNADISGKITATSGKIGGWNITSTYIDSYNGSERFYLASHADSSSKYIYARNSAGTEMFSVSKSGDLYATSATVTGKITANSLSTLSGTLGTTSGSHTGRIYASANSTLAGVTISSRTGGLKITGGLEVTGTFYSFSRGLIVGAQGAPATKTLHYGDFQIYGEFTDSSDIYYKQDIKKLNEAEVIKEIYSIKVVEYKRKDTLKNKRIGMIANEMVEQQPILSSYVTSPDEAGYLSLNYLDIHNASILAIQDLNDRLIKLEEKLK